MAIPILICDDSLMSRKMVQKSLPEGWDVSISSAKNGLEGMEKIREGLGEVVFLDLTMPEMDGFQLLEAMKAENLKSFVFVISADVQPEARARVLDLGAMDFIKKPINAAKLKESLIHFGLI
ncbi:MAG: two-component system chemotaxis response regulator CheY [Phenylobacterium sp.]|jgi:two-component system chemotaxis response regulator CheY